MVEWYEKLERQCSRCQKYQAMKLVRMTRDWFFWQCQFCGFERKHERAWAKYRQKKGKTFLKSNKFKKFTEVQLFETPNHIQIIPVKQEKNLTINFNGNPK